MLEPRFAMGRMARLLSQYPQEGYFYFILLQKTERIIKMKQTLKSTLLILLALVFIVALVSCNTVEKEGLWENATYRKDMEFGKGAKTVVVEVKAADQLVTFTVKTDKDTVGAALLEHGLIAGEEGPYGLYIKVVNGITADYDVDQSYWAFYVNGEYAMSGIELTEITEGTTYGLEYTK
ncbi:MAG: DUF4430 domain-containing protein [Clostridia bacterium]|nr:DUF4430 domain-containing protein [Clostridia bacterium]